MTTPVITASLAYIGKIVELTDVANADRLQSAIVVCGEGGRWQGVVQRDAFEPDAVCEVYLQDAIVPHEERFAFMASKKYRVRICRFRGALSEALIMPLSRSWPWAVGTDITQEVGVVKYERPLSPNLQGVAKGNFPSFLHKTDEPNVQRSQEMVDALLGKPFVITLKLDGSSGTFYKSHGLFGVCSRKLELVDGPSVFWTVARKLGLEDLPDGYAVQAELVGPKIQGNPLGLPEAIAMAFNVFEIANQNYLDHDAAIQFLANHVPAMSWVPVVSMGDAFSGYPVSEVETLTYPNGRAAEGVVIRPQTETWVGRERLSFKVINPLYKEAS